MLGSFLAPLQKIVFLVAWPGMIESFSRAFPFSSRRLSVSRVSAFCLWPTAIFGVSVLRQRLPSSRILL